jgi:hypothetical protein
MRHTLDAYHSINLCQYFRNKYSWSTQTIDTVWWRIHSQAFNNFSEAERMHLDSWATNGRKHKFHDQKPATCHCCYETIELDHLLMCPGESRRSIRRQWLDQLLQFLSEPHTPRCVKFTIYHHVQKWLEQSSKSLYKPIDDTFLKALDQQDTIGWRHFIRGRLTVTWGRSTIISNAMRS